jgi:hypothetical protein
MTAQSAPAWYAYSVLPGQAGAPPCDGVLPGSSVEAVAFGALTVLASVVPRALFDRADAGNRTADPDWMAARIEAHHAVNQAASAAGACLPLAFGALFSSLDRLRDWLEPRRDALLAALGRVEGRAEWALTLQEDEAAHAAWLDRSQAELRRMAGVIAAASEGTGYLLRKRLDKLRAAARQDHLLAVAGSVAAALQKAGLDVLDEPPKHGMPTWSALAQAGADALPPAAASLAAALAPCGLSLRLSGPWPAYGFARAALAEDAVHV